MNYQSILEKVIDQTNPLVAVGHQADYIPALAEVNPDQRGICLHTLSGHQYSVGDSDVRFSIQSISKVFALAMALSLEGDNLWTRMGKEPSGTAFNSLFQLEMEKGIPRNPFINAGAIVMADILVSHMLDPEHDFLTFVRRMADNDSINYNRLVAFSERSTGYLNAAIANLLKYHGNIRNDIERVLQFYCMMCSIEMSCCELARAFLPFADHRRPFSFSGVELTSSQVKRMNAIMQTW